MREFVTNLITLVERGDVEADFCGYFDNAIPTHMNSFVVFCTFIKFNEKGSRASKFYVSSGFFHSFIGSKFEDFDDMRLTWREYYAIKNAVNKPRNCNNSKLSKFLKDKIETSNDKLLTNKKV